MILEIDPNNNRASLKRNNKMRRIFVVCAIILAVFCAFITLILTTPRPTVVVGIGFFDDSDCVSSCWRGLRPKQSTMNDVEIFLSQNFTILRTHIFDGIGLTTLSARAGGDYQVIPTFKEDELIHIFLSANSYRSFDLQIDTILTTLGNPEHIRVGYETASSITATYPYVELYYPDEGYIFHADLEIESLTDDTIELCVQADINITEIHIVEPNPIQDMLANIFHTDSESTTIFYVNQVLNNLDNWTGYRCYTLPHYQGYPYRN